MTQLKYHDGERFRDAPKFKELPEPVGDPLFWWPLHAGYQSETTGFGQGTVHGAQWRRGSYAGQWTLEGDGVDDYVATSDWGGFGSNMDTDLTIAITTEPIDLDNTTDPIRFMRGRADDDDTTLTLGMDTFNDKDLWFRLRDATGDAITIRTDSGFVSDADRKRLVFTKEGNTASDLSIWSDGQEVATNIHDDQAYDSPSDLDSVLLFSGHSAGDPEPRYNGILDNVIVYNRTLTPEEIEEDYRRQPWSEVN